jgi:TfoX/Sxy family transcriptional regulator of competence genes
MAYNEELATRCREIIAVSHKNVEEKAMFGGLCFMVNEKMCVGVEKNRLMLRIDPERYNELIEKEGCAPMDFTGRVMKGFLFVDEEVLNTKSKLNFWIQEALK